MTRPIPTAVTLCAAVLLLAGCSVFQPEQKDEAAPAAAAPAQAAPTGGQVAEPAAEPAAGARAAVAATRYRCNGTRDVLSVTHGPGDATARVSLGAQTVQATKVRGSTGRYTASRVELVEKGKAATLTWQGKKYSCQVRA